MICLCPLLLCRCIKTGVGVCTTYRTSKQRVNRSELIVVIILCFILRPPTFPRSTWSDFPQLTLPSASPCSRQVASGFEGPSCVNVFSCCVTGAGSFFLIRCQDKPGLGCSWQLLGTKECQHDFKNMTVCNLDHRVKTEPLVRFVII